MNRLLTSLIHWQNSGAYVFRPSTPNQKLEVIPYRDGAAKFINTSAGVEVHVEFENPWLRQVTRVMNGLNYVEVEYSVGPIPIDDGRGKEIVTKYSTPIKSNSTFYTDSNGREFQQRRRDSRPTWPLKVFEPVASNWFPVHAASYIEDPDASLAILVDRTQGGSSLLDGSIEFMVQRRILVNDARGVGEPLNETDGGVTPYPPFGNAERWGSGLVVRGIHRIMVGEGKKGANLARSAMDSLFASPLVFVASSASSDTSVSFRRSLFSGLKTPLPSPLMLVTFKKLHTTSSTTGDLPSSEYLIRLGHQYAANEDDVLSRPVTLDLKDLFSGFEVVSAIEVTLTANQNFNDWVKRRMDWTGSGPLPESSVSDSNTTVTLFPMEIRSFILKLEALCFE
jgi:hypothetical protein